jgi:hypothetical protein
VRPYRDLSGRVKVFLLLMVAIAPLAAGGCGEGAEDGSREPDPAAVRIADRFDETRAFADLEAQVRLGPRPSGSAANRRQAAILALKLRRAGVRDVRVQGPHLNVVGTIPGREPGAVVIGAHHDTKDAIPGFVGANDGASGVAVVLELARAVPDRVRGPAIHVALFDAEEARRERPFADDGARGSAQYVRYARGGGKQGSPPIDEIEAMVLFDLVGDCDLRIPLESNSDAALYERFRDAALALDPDGGGAPFEGEAEGVLDDHIPFARAGVRAVDLIDFEFGPGGSPGEWWHTNEDDIDKVCPESLAAVGRPALVALSEGGLARG